MYTSLLISLLAAFVAMLGRQWLIRYLRHAGGSTIERCGDRQRKRAALEKWPFHLFVESLPVMLQIALPLLAYGLCRYMESINSPIAGVLIAFAVLAVVFYLGIIIVGTTSYESPFQTPTSAALRHLWARAKPRLILAALPIVALRGLGEIVQRHILHIIIRLPHANVRHRFCILLKRIRSKIPRLAALKIHRHFHHLPFPTTQKDSCLDTSKEIAPWLTPKDLATIQMTRTDDVRCVSWILRSITDREALDTAIRLASAVRWFEDGTNTEHPYDLVVSTFSACFDSNRKVYAGSRDRAYNSGRAILWIHTLALCKSEEFPRTVPLPPTKYPAPASDPDLGHLLTTNVPLSANGRLGSLLRIDSKCTPSHSQWISNVLLHVSWANRTPLNLKEIGWTSSETLPLDTMLNRLLAWCALLGSLIEKEALKIQDKSCDISCFSPSSYSHHLLPAIAWNRSYVDYPKRSFRLLIPPSPEANSSRVCYPT